VSSNKESTRNVLLVSTLLCVVCSVVVSAVAVGLRPQQEKNAAVDKKRNVLLAAAIIGDDFEGDLESVFAAAGIKPVLVDLKSGDVVEGDPAGFDMGLAMNDPAAVIPVTPDQYMAGITKRPKQVVVYLHEPKGELENIILPVVGQGLWSTMYGYLCLAPDLKTTRGLVFYEHAETPGLGGEVDNPRWRNQFRDRGDKGVKRLRDDQGSYDFKITKSGMADLSSPHQVDGISGATITCRGVDGMLKYWMSDAAYGPFLKKLQKKGGLD